MFDIDYLYDMYVRGVELNIDDISYCYDTFFKNLTRVIRTEDDICHNIGDIIRTEYPESWSDYGDYKCNFEGNYEYNYYVSGNIPAHKVYYDLIDELEDDLEQDFAERYYYILGTSKELKFEKEYLVPEGVYFKIVNIEKNVYDNDIVFDVFLEYIGFNKNITYEDFINNLGKEVV